MTTDGSGRIVEAESLVGPIMLARAVVANVKGWTLARGAATDWLVFRFDIEPGRCNDDGHGLFRLVHWNLAVVTACTAPGRRGPQRPPEDPLYLRSMGNTPVHPNIARNANVRGVGILENFVPEASTFLSRVSANYVRLTASIPEVQAATR